jgi:hypothetical protein
LVFAGGTARVWRTVVGGDPHHQGALELLNISTESVAAYIVIEPGGAVTDWRVHEVPGAEQLVEQMVAADKRLYRAPDDDEWEFGDDAESPTPDRGAGSPATQAER